jgi:hypothetical protein
MAGRMPKSIFENSEASPEQRPCMHITFLKIVAHVVPVSGCQVMLVKALKSSVQEIHHLAVARE